jgi:acetolactate synthase-1/3 small subunit
VRHTLSVLVENKPGVLTRIAGLFGRRAFNIDSLTVAETERQGFSRMTIVARGDRAALEQIEKQLYKLINVIKVRAISADSPVERELCLLKVHADAQSRAAISQLAELFRARIIDVAPRSLVIEATGDREKVDALILNMRPFGIKEIVRSGPVALSRGSSELAAEQPGRRPPAGRPGHAAAAAAGDASDAGRDCETAAGAPAATAPGPPGANL